MELRSTFQCVWVTIAVEKNEIRQRETITLTPKVSDNVYTRRLDSWCYHVNFSAKLVSFSFFFRMSITHDLACRKNSVFDLTVRASALIINVNDSATIENFETNYDTIRHASYWGKKHKYSRLQAPVIFLEEFNWNLNKELAAFINRSAYAARVPSILDMYILPVLV